MSDTQKLSLPRCRGSVRPSVNFMAVSTTAVAARSRGLRHIWSTAGAAGQEKPILQEPYHTLIQFNCCQPWARVGAGMAKMNRSNTSTCTERNRWGLFFINGVGVKLAGWAHVATHWIEWLVYLGCVYRLGDDSCTAVKRLSDAQSMSPISLTSISLAFTPICQGKGLWIGV